MKRLALLLGFSLVFSACTTAEPMTTSSTIPSNTSGFYEGSVHDTVFPYMINVEDPSFDVSKAINEDPDSIGDFGIIEAYSSFNPIVELESRPEDFQSHFETEEGYAMTLEEIEELQDSLNFLESGASGQLYTPQNSPSFEEGEWPDPYLFFTTLQSEGLLTPSTFKEASVNTFAYLENEDFGTYATGCQAFSTLSYDPFLLIPLEEGGHIGSTHFHNEYNYCGAAGGSGSYDMDILFTLNAEDKLETLFLVTSPKDSLSEGPLLSNYNFDYSSKEAPSVRVFGVSYYGNQMAYPHLSYNYRYPYTQNTWDF